MFSCSNYQRGCRGRTNLLEGNCSDCITLHLTSSSPSSSSSSSAAPTSSMDSQSSSSTSYSALLEALQAEGGTDSDSTSQSS
jgi:hypothetical protein